MCTSVVSCSDVVVNIIFFLYVSITFSTSFPLCLSFFLKKCQFCNRKKMPTEWEDFPWKHTVARREGSTLKSEIPTAVLINPVLSATFLTADRALCFSIWTLFKRRLTYLTVLYVHVTSSRNVELFFIYMSQFCCQNSK